MSVFASLLQEILVELYDGWYDASTIGFHCLAEKFVSIFKHKINRVAIIAYISLEDVDCYHILYLASKLLLIPIYLLNEKTLCYLGTHTRDGKPIIYLVYTEHHEQHVADMLREKCIIRDIRIQ